MSYSQEYVDHLLELLGGFGDCRARPMFGGVGIYRDDLMFGLVAGDVFYLKADETNRQEFVRRGLGKFRYLRSGKPCYLSYYEVPAEALDDVETMCAWAQAAWEVALRARQDHA